MFWDNVNTKKIELLEQELKSIRRELESVRLDLQIYYDKLKKVKNIKSVQEQVTEEDKTENLFNSVIVKS